MKASKLLLSLLGISITLNIGLLFYDSDKPQTTISEISTSDFTQDPDNADNSDLFEHDGNPDEVNTENQDTEQYQTLKKKIKILVKQNHSLQVQIDNASQKQAGIIEALNTIADKIDSQLLMPSASSPEFQSSDYNLDFNSISKDVVKKCMKLTAKASSNIRFQQKQNRKQLLLNEEIDTLWSSEIESTIQSVLTNNQLQDSQLVALNCRTTICQITVQHNSPAAKKLFEVPFFSHFQQSVSQYDETFDKSTNLSTGIFYLTRNREN
ncbi:MAG: hypothetical protein ACC657_13120 [Thiohalomonadales bacterium]